MAGEKTEADFAESVGAKFLEATKAAATASEQSEPEADEVVAKSGAEESEVAEDAADAGGQQAKEPDPWDGIKQKFTPEQIQRALETAEKVREVEENARAMRREASLRNEAASKEKREAEELRRITLQNNERMDSALRAARQLARDGNGEMAVQWLRALGGSEEDAASLSEVEQPRGTVRGRKPDPEVLELRRELDEIKRQQAQSTFAMNRRDVESAVLSAMAKNPILQSPAAQKAGLRERVARAAITAIYEKDRRMQESGEGGIDPWKVGVLDREALEAVQAEVAPFETYGKAHLDGWRAERREKNKNLPPSGKGASASVRGVPSSMEPIPSGASPDDFERITTKRFLAAAQAPKPP